MTQELPGVLQEIAEVAGLPAALAVAARVGGGREYIPAKCADDHWLVECAGRAAADKICAHFAAAGSGLRIDIPLYHGGAYHQLKRVVAKRIHDLHSRGKSSRVIAQEVGVTQRTVHRHRRSHRGDDDSQGSLF